MIPKIIFEDTHLIVLSKPAGMLSQSDISGEESLVDWMRRYLGRNYVGLVHRLDRNTSGLMVLGKRSKAATRLSESLKAGTLNRTYIAIVAGDPPTSARLEHHLFKDEKTNVSRVVAQTHKEGKRAVLTFNCLARAKFKHHDIAALHLTLQTGRAHQIRIQCAQEGYPLLGDKKYGSKIEEPLRPALHSYSLSVEHPMTKEVLSFKESLPADLLTFMPKGTPWP